MMPRASILTTAVLALGLPATRGEGQAEMDVASYLRRLDVVYQQPAVRSVDYLPVGNGQLGLLVDPLGSQTLGGYVMKSDVWDYRHARPDPLSGKVPVGRYRELRAAGKVDEVKRLCDAEPQDYSRPAPRMLGQVRVALEVNGATPTELSELADYQQRLVPSEAVVQTRYAWRGVTTEAESFVAADRNVMVFRFRDRAAAPVRRVVGLTRHAEPDMGPPAFGCDDRCAWVDYKFPDGFRYVMAVGVHGDDRFLKTLARDANNWSMIRSEGTQNSFRNEAGAAVMRIQGKAEASNGWQRAIPVFSTDEYPTMRLTLKGTPNARYFVDLVAPPADSGGKIDIVRQTGWTDSPSERKTVDYPLPKGRRVGAVIVYLWTKDGALAANEWTAVEFVAADGKKLAVNLSEVERPFDAGIVLAPAAQNDTVVYVSAATSMECKDPLARAKALVAEARQAGFDAVRAAHAAWWREFWRKSWIAIPDQEIEAVYYAQLYQLASSSRGPKAPGLCQLFSPYPRIPWNGCYFDMNLNLMYVACQTLNRPDLQVPYFRTYWEALPGARRNAKELFGARGAAFPHTMGPDGQETSGAWWRYQMYHTGFAALQFWWGYLYTLDRKFLADRAYPFLVEAADFYSDYLVRDEHGKLNCLPPNCTINETNSYDDVWQRKNDPFDLELVRRVFLNVIEASEVLGCDATRRETWRGTLRDLADLPANGPIIARFEGDRTKSHGFCVVDTMGPIWPACTVRGSDPRAAATILDAFASGAGVQCFSYSWMAAASAHAGRPDLAVKALYGQLGRHTFPSGVMGEGGVEPVPGYGRGAPRVLIGESGPAFCAAVNEMLLQSWPDGVIRVFPAVPAEWSNVSYRRLGALGALAVSACRRGGQTRHVVIESGQGAPCRLALPATWQRADLRVREMPAGRVVEPKWEGDVAVFATARGATYVVDRPSDAFETHAPPAAEARPATGPRKHTGLGPTVVREDSRR
jgi:hypothetical protein